MAKVMIGHARFDEDGKSIGNKAGDQTKKEVSISDWYKHKDRWFVMRHPDAEVRDKIAECVEYACANDNIGYSIPDRSGLWNLVKNKGYDPREAKSKTSCDCSSLVRLACNYAGVDMPDFNTGSQPSIMSKNGFEKIDDSSVCDYSVKLVRGDVLVSRIKSHTCTVLNNGIDGTGYQPDEKKDKTAIVTGNSVNIRVGPGTNRASIGKLNKGDKVELTGNTRTGWAEIKTNSLTGWMFDQYLNKE